MKKSTEQQIYTRYVSTDVYKYKKRHLIQVLLNVSSKLNTDLQIFTAYITKKYFKQISLYIYIKTLMTNKFEVQTMHRYLGRITF